MRSVTREDLRVLRAPSLWETLSDLFLMYPGGRPLGMSCWEKDLEQAGGTFISHWGPFSRTGVGFCREISRAISAQTATQCAGHK